MTKFLLFFTATLAFQVFAQGYDPSGGSDGGGGNGIICYSSDSYEEIVSVDLLDFFEGKILDGYNIPEYFGNYEEIYSEVIKKAASPDILKELETGMALSKGFRFLPTGVRLQPVDDSGEIFLPKNCRVEQLANFQGPSRIFIVKDFWDRMSETSKAGLLMHEFIWMKDRESEVKKSSRARRNVARFFADNFDFGKIETNDFNPDGYQCNRIASSSINILSYDFTVSAPDQSDICHITLSKLSGMTYYTGHTAMINNCSSFFNIPAPGLGRLETVTVISASDQTETHKLELSNMLVEDSNQSKRYQFSISVKDLEFSGYDDHQRDIYCFGSLSKNDKR